MTSYQKKNQRHKNELEKNQEIVDLSHDFSLKVSKLFEELHKKSQEKFLEKDDSTEITFKSLINGMSWSLCHLCDCLIANDHLDKKIELIKEISSIAKDLIKLRNEEKIKIN